MAFHREPDFAAPVTIKANNLPLGVACEPAEVRGAPARYRLSCEAGPDTQPGEYEVELRFQEDVSGFVTLSRITEGRIDFVRFVRN